LSGQSTDISHKHITKEI